MKKYISFYTGVLILFMLIITGNVNAQLSGEWYSGNTLNFRPLGNGQHVLLNFHSHINYGSDRGFLLFQEESGQNPGTSSEDVRLTLGVYNDFRQSGNLHSDELWFQGGGRIVSNVGAWDNELNSIIGLPAVGATGGYEWRINNQPSMMLNHDGEVVMSKGLFFSQSTYHSDGKPYARLLESWGIRFASPDPRWVFSSAPSVLVGYQPAGQNWGDGNLFVQNNVGIGTTNPDAKLTVAGKIHAQEIKVTTTAGADFVFGESYQLRTLKETEAFINENKHLPDIPSAREMVEEGLMLGEMNIKLLQKIEELTLYVIELKKDNDGLNKLNQDLIKRIENIEYILQ